MVDIEFWMIKVSEIDVESKNLFQEVKNYIEKFVLEIECKESGFCEEDVLLIQNRIKGIKLINKMNKNAVTNGLDRLNNNKEKDMLRNYFNYIELYILPIVDGIESGILYVKNSGSEVLNYEVMPFYKRLYELYRAFLDRIEVSKKDIKVNDKIDFSYMEVIGVEETENVDLDECVESVIRNSYEYRNDIYNEGVNYIVRKAQVMGFKKHLKGDNNEL